MSLKAFELVPVLDKLSVGNDRLKGTIECIESWQGNIYIGTSDCHLFHYAVEQGTSPTGMKNFRHKLQRHKQLGLKKPIKQLLICAAVGQLLVLCEGSVFCLTTYGLEMKHGVNKEVLRGVTVMARNERPDVFRPSEVQVCVGLRKKCVQVLNVLEDKIVVLKEVNVNDPPSTLSIDGRTICTTVGNQYFLINFTTSATQPLFTYEAHNTIPLIKRIGKEEFLLNGPTDSMGMIVNAEGLSNKQPLTWSDGLKSVAYKYPYIIALGNNSVTVHSILDQQQKQAMTFQKGIVVGDFDDFIFVALERSVMAFVDVPLDKQIQMLIVEYRVEEALTLSLVANQLNEKKYGDNFMRQVQAQAGFAHFSKACFKQASDLFIQSEMDPREVIALYPSLTLKRSTFTPSRPLLHNIKDVSAVAKGSKTIYAEAIQFVSDFLTLSRSNFPQAAVEIDTALVQLYAEVNNPKLISLVSAKNSCLVENAISCLTQYNHHHSLALFYCYHQQTKKAMELWKQLIHGDLDDPSFPGIDFVVTFLTHSNDYPLVWDSLPWLLEKDQSKSVQVLTERSNSENDKSHFSSDTVTSFLTKYPIALQLYLEDLVHIKQIEQEKVHTHLALIYTNTVLRIMRDPLIVVEELEAARTKLKALLEWSSLYRVSTILQRIGDLPLHLEVAVLYGKIEQHDKALKILVYKLKDYNEAEKYCEMISKGKSDAFRQKVFHTLLEVYLNPDEEDIRPEHLVLPAVKLLNSRPNEFDAVDVLQKLPEDWAVDMIGEFLMASVRNSFHSRRLLDISSSLCRSNYLYTRASYISVQNGAIPINEERTCDLCKKPFTESTSTRYPNGTIVHVHCGKDKRVCPVTGATFS